ncbi:MAG: alpha/beta fold hydrolase [Bacteroidota bacterium]
MPTNSTNAQVFLLHFAGGNCYSYDFLKKYLNSELDVFPLELPGRGKRFREAIIHNKAEAIRDYANQIKKLRNGRPYLIFGHSMGASLGLYVAHEMEKSGDIPLHLIVSGNAGPGAAANSPDYTPKPLRYLMDDEGFKKELRVLGGVSEEVLENDELYQFFVPIIKADFEVIEKQNQLPTDLKLHTSIYAMMGSEEELSSQIRNWKRFTALAFQFKIFEGHHFFINDYPREVAQIINTSYKEQFQF